jgi:multiple antibiotic resistance protein
MDNSILQGLDSIVDQFVLLWVVIEPITVVSVFLAVTGDLQRKLRLAVAVRAIIIAAAVLLFFIVAGQTLLQALGVDLAAFQIAGGLVLFTMALSMVFGRLATSDHAEHVADRSAMDLAVFPIAVPTIAGPGAMLSVVLLTDSNRFSLSHQALTAAILGVVLLITLGLLAAARPLQRLIGTAGASVVSRVMGLVLATIAVKNVLEAVTLYFKIPR